MSEGWADKWGTYYLVNPKHIGWASIPEGSTISVLTPKSAGLKILFFSEMFK